MRIAFSTPPSNPILQVLYFIGAAIVLVGAVVMGAVVLAFVVGFALVVGLVVWARVWWLRRKLGRMFAETKAHAGPRASQPKNDGGVEITEVEYHVVRESPRDAD